MVKIASDEGTSEELRISENLTPTTAEDDILEQEQQILQRLTVTIRRISQQMKALFQHLPGRGSQNS